MSDLLLKRIEIINSLAAPLKEGLTIEFKKPLCFLVGDNGIGKSTVMDCLSDYFGFKDQTYMKRPDMKKAISVVENTQGMVKYMDFHSEDRKFSSAFGEDNIGLQISQMRLSAGQCTLSILYNINLKDFKNGLILMDEPCRGLSIKNQWGLAKIINGLLEIKKCQLVVVTHSSIILECFKDSAQFYSINEGKDTTYKEFMLEQLKP